MASPHQRTQEVFAAALDLPAAERAAFVAAACGPDAELRERVLTLLGRADDDDTFLAEPLPLAALGDAAAPALPGLRPGEHIGPYELVRPLGEGGFGAVWQAQQRQPVAREVAVKVLKFGMDTEQVVARFAQERQALALLDHPGIARVLDAGVTAAGRPFFVMELVDGRPLVEFCEVHSLPIRERLRLFAQVCDAVQHAHGRGIIHRDLKPSNVLVVERDGVATTKVIDFGIAKAVGRRLTEQSLHTEVSQIVGTLEYMSPEQASGVADIDIRTDVWSLGVMLYELLTGATPFAPDAGWADWRFELQRRIRETDPLPPSLVVARGAVRASELAARRRTTAPRLAGEVRGELDWIVLKTLERERGRRYQTALELGQDVQRFLAGEAVVAAPPRVGYLARKFVRRHRGVVAAAAAVLLTLAGGVFAFAWQAAVARGERDRAVTAQAQSEQVQQLVLEALGSADPVDGGDQGALVVDAMARAGALLDAGRLAEQPEVELGLRLTIAGVQCNNGAPGAALAHAERAMELARRLFPGDHERRVTAGNILARALRDLGRDADEEPVRGEALAMARRLWPDGHALLVQTMQQYATCLDAIGRDAEGGALLAESAAMAERVFPGDHWVKAGLANARGHVLFVAGRSDAAVPLFRAAVAMAERLQPGGHPRTARFLANEAMALGQLGRLPEAEPLLRAALTMTERAFPGDHPDVVTRRGQLGQTLRDLGRFDEAQALFVAALQMSQRLFAGDHPCTAGCLEQLGNLAAQRGRPDGVEPLRDAVAMRRRLNAGDHPELAQAIAWLAQARRVAGVATADVAAGLQEALAMTRRLHPGDHDTVRVRLRELGFHSWSVRQYAAAAEAFEEALAMARRLHPGDSRIVLDLLDDLGSALSGEGEHVEATRCFAAALAMLRALADGTPAEAARLLHKGLQARVAGGADLAAGVQPAVDEVLALARGAVQPVPAEMLETLRMLAGTLFRGGHEDLAMAVLHEAVAFARRQYPGGHRNTVLALEESGFLAARRGDTTKARAAFTEALELVGAVAPADAALRERLEQRLAAARQAAK